VQASRTISAFTVVMVTIALLWYVGASSCTSFFFAFQGFLPMQARARGRALGRPPACGRRPAAQLDAAPGT
jgi:16S rRNA C1402 (ribose-2'-O) methylase RsmI